MEEEEEEVAVAPIVKRRGCIRTTRGPWLVQRQGRDGALVTSWRRPSERERENNRQRERRQRQVAVRIYAGLRKHGNYELPKHANQNDILKALCEEAGWHVEEDGTIHRREATVSWYEDGSTVHLKVNAIDSLFLFLFLLLLLLIIIIIIMIIFKKTSLKSKPVNSNGRAGEWRSGNAVRALPSL